MPPITGNCGRRGAAMIGAANSAIGEGRDAVLEQSTISAVKGAGGAITHFVAIQVDIGERKRERRTPPKRTAVPVACRKLFSAFALSETASHCSSTRASPKFTDMIIRLEIIQLGSLTPLYVTT